MDEQTWDTRKAEIEKHVAAIRVLSGATPDPLACEHGVLKRQCRICELEAEREQMRMLLTEIAAYGVPRFNQRIRALLEKGTSC